MCFFQVRNPRSATTCCYWILDFGGSASFCQRTLENVGAGPRAARLLGRLVASILPRQPKHEQERYGWRGPEGDQHQPFAALPKSAISLLGRGKIHSGREEIAHDHGQRDQNRRGHEQADAWSTA